MAKYDKLITLESLKTAVTKLKSLIADKASKTDVDTSLSAKVSKSGDTMTGKLTAPYFETGSSSDSYFQSQRFRGEGTASTYYHAIDFGYANHDHVDFHEYGGTWNFYKNTGGTSTSGTLVASIQSDGVHAALKGNADTATSATSADSATKATQDSDGNTINTTYLSKAGGTMTGQLKTSFKESVAVGAYMASATTVPKLLEEVRYSSGCMGSANLSAYNSIPAAWYNFIYLPHRSGGLNGSANEDNCNYGSLILIGMTVTNQAWIIQYQGSSIQTCFSIRNTDTTTWATVTIATSAWSSKAATIAVSGVTADNAVDVAPAEASYDAYVSAGIRASAQVAGKLTFKCKTTPTASISVNVKTTTKG